MNGIKLSRVLVISVASVGLIGGINVFGFSGGAGTESDPYQISSKSDLLELAVNTNHYEKHFILVADIDFAGSIFTQSVIAPDVSSNSYFQGVTFGGSFDGNNHTIKNLHIDAQYSNYVGLFGTCKNAEIIDLSMDAADVSGGTYVGGVCGYYEDSTANNCHVSGSIKGQNDAGGLFGKITGSTLWDCHSAANVEGGQRTGGLCGSSTGESGSCTIVSSFSTGQISGYQSTGGLCGYNMGTVSNCYATGAVDGTFYTGGLFGEDDNGRIYHSYASGVVSGKYYAGGFCGHTLFGRITSCYSSGSVSAQSNVGGFCGENYRGTISGCYAKGTVSGKTSIGGFCGSQYSSTASACFWDTQTSGQTVSAGGTGKTTAQMQVESTFTNAGWDFPNIWKMANYPVLAWQRGVAFQLWTEAQGISANLRDYSAAPAGDGIPNLLKYACGLSAMTSCAPDDVFFYSVSSNGQSFVMTYYKSKQAAGVAITPVWTDSLSGGNWLSTGFVIIKVGENDLQEIWEASTSLAGSGFMRVRAEMTE